ncbi:hypothetical protein M8494_20955 [Serratia ureilytica]
MIGRMGYTADNFAQSMRQQLVNQQVIQAFGDSGFVLPSESQAMAALVLQSATCAGDHRFESAAGETERRRRRTEGVYDQNRTASSHLSR